MQFLSAGNGKSHTDDRDAGTVAMEDMIECVPMFGAAELRVSRDKRCDAPIVGVRVGTLIGISESGLPMVDFPGNPAAMPVVARTTIQISPADEKRGAVLMFEDGSPDRPILLGLLERAPASIAEPIDEQSSEDEDPLESPMSVEADGRRVVVAAEQELVLRCGKASITLTKAGKVLIRGAYLSSRSSGVNRIKGSSVQIN